MTAAPILFEHFDSGRMIGSVVETVGERELETWRSLYPADRGRDAVPVGLATAIMMRAYLKIVAPRPPGNLHVRQRLALGAPIVAGEPLTVRLDCKAKEMRGTRRLVELGVSAERRDGRLAFHGAISLYWAA